MNFVVTTSAFGSSKTQIWNPSRPLALGHPFQWVIERTKDGLRVRNISALKKGILSTRDISNELLKAGTEIELDGKSPVALRIRPVSALAPAFAGKSGASLTVFACAGNWVLSSELLAEKDYVAKVGTTEIFILKRMANQFSLHSKIADLKIQAEGKSSRSLNSGENAQFTAEDLAEMSFNFGSQSWRFGLSNRPEARPSRGVLDQESDAFKKALRYTAVGLGAFIALSWLWPQSKPNTQELIPVQFAKIVLSKPKSAESKASTAPANNMAETAAQSAPKKVQDAAVVQAFRAKALNNAISGLLKGGMTTLLAQSDFVSGAKASQDARRIFDSKSNSLKATGPDTGAMTNKNVQVAALGGTTGKAGVGYGKGEHAGVKGQGGSFVTMDTGGSSVDEGLTKDEVGEVIHRHLSEVRYCYESAMLRTPDIEGKLMTNFTIGANGMVKSSEVKSSTLPDPRLDDCILRRLATWKFPLPRGGIDVAVTYPFIFKTLGR